MTRRRSRSLVGRHCGKARQKATYGVHGRGHFQPASNGRLSRCPVHRGMSPVAKTLRSRPGESFCVRLSPAMSGWPTNAKGRLISSGNATSTPIAQRSTVDGRVRRTRPEHVMLRAKLVRRLLLIISARVSWGRPPAALQLCATKPAASGLRRTVRHPHLRLPGCQPTSAAVVAQGAKRGGTRRGIFSSPRLHYASIRRSTSGTHLFRVVEHARLVRLGAAVEGLKCPRRPPRSSLSRPEFPIWSAPSDRRPCMFPAARRNTSSKRSDAPSMTSAWRVNGGYCCHPRVHDPRHAIQRNRLSSQCGQAIDHRERAASRLGSSRPRLSTFPTSDNRLFGVTVPDTKTKFPVLTEPT